MTTIDDTDRDLLAALKQDARASVTELSHRLHLSRTTVKQRLTRLVDRGVIRRFTIVTDTEENPDIRAIMMVELQGEMSRSVLQALRKIPEISAIYSTNGTWDMALDIHTETLARFDRVLRQVREISGVLNSETSLLLDRMY